MLYAKLFFDLFYPQMSHILNLLVILKVIYQFFFINNNKNKNLAPLFLFRDVNEAKLYYTRLLNDTYSQTYP
jgi:hypothetical protein